MTPLPKELEALMPEPVAWQIAVMRAEEDGMTIVGWRDEFSKASFNYSRLPKREMFTTDQMREAIKAATERERERAAAVCEDMTNALSQEWRAGHKSSAHLEGQSDGAFDCATAIRGGGREG